MARMLYAHVVRELGEARDAVLERFAVSGGDRERWARRDREMMAEALTRTEDELEMRSPGPVDSGAGKNQGCRRALRAVRRRLEVELWP